MISNDLNKDSESAMAAADASLWPVILGGLLGVGGTLVGVIGTTIRDAAQQRHEKAKRRADKFEELVAAVYEFDHWLEGIRQRAFGVGDATETVSPFAKVQSISSVYFPQFSELIGEIDRASNQYCIWIYRAEQLRIAKNPAQVAAEGFGGAFDPYAQKREALLNALQKFAREEFQ